MRAATWLAPAALLLGAATVRAQVSLQTDVSARQVEVGESFQVQLSAMADSDVDSPQNPRLTAPKGMEVRGPSVSSQMRVNIVNGRMQRSTGVKLTWTVTANRPGRFRIGPASVELGGRRHNGELVEVEVLPAGSLQQRRRPQPGQRGFDPFDFFDPFGGGGPFPRGALDPTDDDFSDDLPPVAKELMVEVAPDPAAFVRAVGQPERVVVGQQVTLDIFAYSARGPLRIQNVSEPSRTDFLAFHVEDADADPVRVPIGGDVWVAQRVRQYAMFPLRAGKLSIGAVEALFGGDGIRSRRTLERKSAPLEIIVEEPPLAERPPGYRLGDVGQYNLTAQVEPRSVSAGEAVSVVARLEGVGNVPAKIAVPQRHGVEWLEPNVVSDVEPRGAIVRGFRSFTYVVKLTEPGEVDLGELNLPYWDPEAQAYRTARALLGKISVTPGVRHKAAPEPAASPLANMGKPRSRMSTSAPPPEALADRRSFWFLLLGAPLGVVLADAGVRTARWLGRRRLEQSKDPRTLAQRALREAKVSGSQKPETVLALLERSVFLAIEAGTGLRARALLKGELAHELQGAGVSPDVASNVVGFLERCDGARYTGFATSDNAELVREAERLVQALLRAGRQR